MGTPVAVTKKIEEFFSKYPLKKYKKGEILILADENPKYIFYLQSGLVREYDISYRGDEIVVNVFKPLSFFPMSWSITATPNRYFFEANEDVSVRIAPPEDVLNFIKTNSDIMFDLISRLYSGVDGMRRRMAHLMAGTASSRLLFELVIECRRFGKVQKDGSYIIKMSESEIGSRAGLSRETVSRCMKDLKKSNLISVSKSGIVLKDLDTIEQKLGTEL